MPAGPEVRFEEFAPQAIWRHCPRRIHSSLAKHAKSFNLVDTLSVGVNRLQRNFEPVQRHVKSWRQAQITDAPAKLAFYSAFVEGKLDAAKSLLSEIHRLYFERSIRSSRRGR